MPLMWCISNLFLFLFLFVLILFYGNALNLFKMKNFMNFKHNMIWWW